MIFDMNKIFILFLLVILFTPNAFAQDAQGSSGVTITNETDAEIKFSLKADNGSSVLFTIRSHSSRKYNCNPRCNNFYFKMATNIKTIDYRLPNDGGGYAIKRNGRSRHWDLYALAR